MWNIFESIIGPSSTNGISLKVFIFWLFIIDIVPFVVEVVPFVVEVVGVLNDDDLYIFNVSLTLSNNSRK